MAFAPAPSDIAEYGKDRQFVIVVPKNEWIMPDQQETESGDDQSGDDRAEEILPPINADFHRCRKNWLQICVSSVFIRGETIFRALPGFLRS